MLVYGKSSLSGNVTVPPSKSAAHRAILCAALSKGSSVVSNIDDSRDMQATLGAVRALGAVASYDKEQKSVSIDSSNLGALSGGEIDCIESGSTLRFLIPIAAALGGTWRFTGSGRLPQRPLDVYRDILPEHGVEFRTNGGLPLEISGKLSAGLYKLPGNVSSQFVTGLLMALPMLNGNSEIILTSPLESAGYVELTVSVLKDYGIKVDKTANGWSVSGSQSYRAENYSVEGDWSQAAFYLSMAALNPGGEKIHLHGLNRCSVQGDKACVEAFGGFGLKTEWNGETLTAWNPDADKPFAGLEGYIVDAAQIPDMVPSLAACAALCKGETRIINAARLRLKESDRLAAMEAALNSVGGRVSVTDDGLIIQGVEQLSGGTAMGQNDHRVVMALAACALRSRAEIFVTDEQSIKKSYPGFLDDFRAIGGLAHVVDLG